MKLKKILALSMMFFIVTTSLGVNYQIVKATDTVEQEQPQSETETTEKVETESSEQAEENASDNSVIETEEATQSDAVNQSEKNDNANSWRYTAGELDTSKIDSQNGSARSYASQYTTSSFTRKGIDVSEHQGQIDWAAVKASGIEFAILRVGYGDNVTSQDDKWWAYNVSECERLGIPFGVYIYSYATNVQMAQSEAEHVLRLIAGHNLTYPVYYDMEDNSTLGSQAVFGDIASTFCTTIQNAGYAPGVYGNTNWFTNYLTDARFSQWHRWVAQFNSVCTYQGEYAMWQYSSTGAVSGISGYVDMNYLVGYPANHGQGNALGIPNELLNSVSYAAHVQDIGWQDDVSNGLISGTVGSNKHMEAVTVAVNGSLGIGVKYRTYVHGDGWQDYVADGEISGTTGQNKYIEALGIELTGEYAEQYEIYYRTHVSNLGWLGWTKDGEMAGSVGYDYSVEAIQVLILNKDSSAPGDATTPFMYIDKSVQLSYQAHVSDVGWQNSVENNSVAGTVGKNRKIEALKMVTNMDYVGIQYASYVQDSGWQDYVTDGNISGTVGKNKRIEAVKIQLTGDNSSQYDVFYRVHVSNKGWLGWTKNGEMAGTYNYGEQIEAIQVMIIVKDCEYAPSESNAYLAKTTDIEYQAHVRNVGWQPAVQNGLQAGTTGQALPIEALAIALKNKEFSGSIRYQAHVRDVGWQNWKTEGHIAGTTGRALSVEAIKIELTEEMSNQYDIYYKVHVRDFGWLGWAKDGEMAGTQGYAKPVEAINIKLVRKGETFSEYDASQKASMVK